MQIRELRLAAGVSQKELARMVSSSQPAIARLEADGGMPRIETLERVAQALGAALVIGLRPVPKPVSAPSKQAAQVVPVTRKAAPAVSGPAMAGTKAKVPPKARPVRPAGAVRSAAEATGVRTATAKSPTGAHVAVTTRRARQPRWLLPRLRKHPRRGRRPGERQTRRRPPGPEIFRYRITELHPAGTGRECEAWKVA